MILRNAHQIESNKVTLPKQNTPKSENASHVSGRNPRVDLKVAVVTKGNRNARHKDSVTKHHSPWGFVRFSCRSSISKNRSVGMANQAGIAECIAPGMPPGGIGGPAGAA